MLELSVLRGNFARYLLPSCRPIVYYKELDIWISSYQICCQDQHSQMFILASDEVMKKASLSQSTIPEIVTACGRALCWWK